MRVDHPSNYSAVVKIAKLFIW